MDTARETMTTFQLLNSAQKDLENHIESQQLDIKELEEIREDQEDLMDHQQEVKERLDQSYDEWEAIGELEDLKVEMEGDLEFGQVPSYLLPPPEPVLPPAPVGIIQNQTPPKTQDQKQDVYEISAIPETI